MKRAFQVRLAVLAACGVLAALGLVYLFRHDPVGGAPYPKCVFKKTTGFYCAGCGSTRAAHALLHFDIETAFRKNPLLVLGLPFLALGVALELAAWLFGDRYQGPRVRLRGPWIWMIPTLLFGFWILRNVPAWPFTVLAPH